MFLQWISIGRGCARQKIKAGHKPRLVVQVLEAPLTGKKSDLAPRGAQNSILRGKLARTEQPF